MFMNSGKRYTNEFKIEAIKQVTERGYSVTDVENDREQQPLLNLNLSCAESQRNVTS